MNIREHLMKKWGRGSAMEPEKQSGALIKGALALTIAALITKILSAVYRVPFQNIVGDIGFYIYQQVYPIYAFALVLSTYGFPVVLSKLYMERKNSGDRAAVSRLLFFSGGFIFFVCLAAFLLLYFGAEGFAVLMGDADLAVLIKVVSAVFLLIPFTSLFRGYFQGSGNMVPTAYSQVTEQLIRVGTILAVSIILVKEGLDLYKVGAGAVLGSVTGGASGLFVLAVFLWLKRKPAGTLRISAGELADFHDAKIIFKALFVQGFAICISNMLLIFMQLADSLNLYSLLLETGMDMDVAKGLKGVYDRGQPLIQLGAVVATSMSLSLVPLITNEKMKGKTQSLHSFIQLALRVSLAIGLGAAAGLFGIMEPANIMLFENSKGTAVLQTLGWMILPASLIITITAILQGLGQTFFPAVVVVGGFAVKYGLNVVLVPVYGTMGAALASNIALWLILFILYIRLRTLHKQPLLSRRFTVLALVAALLMYAFLEIFLFVTGLFIPGTEERIPSAVQALSAVAVGGLAYLWIMIRGKGFTVEELTMLPAGSKLTFLFPSRNRR